MFVGTRMNATRTQESQELSFTRMTRPGPSVTFREHEGRGYWRGDSWETLPEEGGVVREERR